MRGLIGVISTFVVVLVVTLVIVTIGEKVPEGKVAVVYSPSGGAEQVLHPGWHWIGPFKKTTEYPTRLQTIKDKVTVSTSDGKRIEMKVTYNLQVVNDDKKILGIFKTFGSQDIDEVEKNYLYSKLFKSSRETVSTYSLLDIYGSKTNEASDKITKDFSGKVDDLGFQVTEVTLGTPEADPQTQSAIDARIAAAQQNEQKKLELENDKIEAQRKSVQAQGDADKKLIEAKAEAEANEIISKSVTDQVLKKMEMEARIKHGWVEVNGGSVLTEK